MGSHDCYEMDIGGEGRRAEGEQQKVELSALVIAVAASVLLAVPFSVWAGRGAESATSVELDGRVNPNVAPAASLVRLPGIGVARAHAIVQYRERAVLEGTGKRAFEDCDDLEQIRGIGPKTAEKICGYLKFE